jgi:tricorn protease
LGGGAGGRGGRGGGAANAQAAQYVIANTNAAIRPGEGGLRIADMEVHVDPIAEWKQMYHEVWRIERSYFYDPNLHGVANTNFEKEYEKYLQAVASRSDLNYIFHDMLSEITSGHLRGGGGNIPAARTIQGGLLGADYEIANGRYRFKRIYTGESWNPQLRAPLSQPGLKVNAGDYLLEVAGHDLKGNEDVQEFLEGKAEKQVVLRIGPDPSGANAREIVVTPVANEQQLRHQAWVEGNRAKVEKLSGGKLAYVYMPDTGQGGLTSFNRYYFAQTDKQGVVLDERFNGGGQVADYVIEVMNRQLLSYWSPRYGAIYRSPQASILGPKVMIINEMAGSGGDCMPWMFHYTKTGTLVGKRTWGGLIGVGQYPPLMDGGNVTAPDFGFFSPSGEWEVENHGVAPDVPVEMDPKSVAEGHDPQLERAVAIALGNLEKNPPPQPKKPKYPNYQTLPRPVGAGAAGNAQQQ